jgi:hypothetical protein
MERILFIGKIRLATISLTKVVSFGRSYKKHEIVQEAYVIPMTLENATTTKLMKYENNYKPLNLITITLGRNVYDRISHIDPLNLNIRAKLIIL